MQRTVLAAGVAALAIGMAGCGSAKPLTKAQFTKQANSICLREQRRAVYEKGELAARYIRLQQRKAAAIGALKPPQELQARFDAYTRFLAARAGVFEQIREAMRAKHVTKELQERSGQMQVQERRLAGALGLVDCRNVG